MVLHVVASVPYSITFVDRCKTNSVEKCRLQIMSCFQNYILWFFVILVLRYAAHT